MTNFTLSRPEVNRKLSFGPDGPAPVRLTEKYRPATLADVVGQGAVVHQLQSFLDAPYPRGFIFAGETGTGKTTCARALANDMGINRDWDLHEIKSASCDAEAIDRGLSALRQCGLNGGWKMLLIDEADTMSDKARKVLLSEMEDLPSRSIVVLTTNHPDRFDARFLDRFEGPITFAHDCTMLALDAQTLANRVWSGETGEPTGPDVSTLPNLCQGGALSFRRVVNAVADALRNWSPTPIRETPIVVEAPIAEIPAPPAVEVVEDPKWTADVVSWEISPRNFYGVKPGMSIPTPLYGFQPGFPRIAGEQSIAIVTPAPSFPAPIAGGSPEVVQVAPETPVKPLSARAIKERERRQVKAGNASWIADRPACEASVEADQTTEAPAKSEGHLAFIGNHEYFRAGNYVFSQYIFKPIGADGRRVDPGMERHIDCWEELKAYAVSRIQPPNAPTPATETPIAETPAGWDSVETSVEPDADDIIRQAVIAQRGNATDGTGWHGCQAVRDTFNGLTDEERKAVADRLDAMEYMPTEPSFDDEDRFAEFVGDCVHGIDLPPNPTDGHEIYQIAGNEWAKGSRRVVVELLLPVADGGGWMERIIPEPESMDDTIRDAEDWSNRTGGEWFVSIRSADGRQTLYCSGEPTTTRAQLALPYHPTPPVVFSDTTRPSLPEPLAPLPAVEPQAARLKALGWDERYFGNLTRHIRREVSMSLLPDRTGDPQRSDFGFLLGMESAWDRVMVEDPHTEYHFCPEFTDWLRVIGDPIATDPDLDTPEDRWNAFAEACVNGHPIRVSRPEPTTDPEPKGDDECHRSKATRTTNCKPNSPCGSDTTPRIGSPLSAATDAAEAPTIKARGQRGDTRSRPIDSSTYTETASFAGRSSLPPSTVSSDAPRTLIIRGQEYRYAIKPEGVELTSPEGATHYLIDGECSCADAFYRGENVDCKHARAARDAGLIPPLLDPRRPEGVVAAQGVAASEPPKTPDLVDLRRVPPPSSLHDNDLRRNMLAESGSGSPTPFPGFLNSTHVDPSPDFPIAFPTVLEPTMSTEDALRSLGLLAVSGGAPEDDLDDEPEYITRPDDHPDGEKDMDDSLLPCHAEHAETRGREMLAQVDTRQLRGLADTIEAEVERGSWNNQYTAPWIRTIAEAIDAAKPQAHTFGYQALVKGVFDKPPEATPAPEAEGHTPGPWDWEYHPDTRRPIALAAHEHDVILATEIDGHPCLVIPEADMAVIKAAPDLLEACEATLAQLDYLQSLWSKEGITDRVAGRLREAVAMAKDIKGGDR